MIRFPHCIPDFTVAFPFPFRSVIRQKQTILIQHSSKSWTANATAFVKAGPFSRGKEITKQWNDYETIASFTLFDKRLGNIRHVNPNV